jgi:hypothetical protein
LEEDMDRTTYPANHYGANRVIVAGRFRPNAGSAVDNTLNKGVGFTVARTGAGAFTVTIAGYPFGQIDDVQWSLWLNAADDKFVQGGPIDSAAGTIKVVVWDISGAAATDVASNANNWITFSCVIRDSSEEN